MNFSGFELSPTQKGAVTEYLVSSILMMTSRGRLSPFMPLSDDHGIDLLVLDKVTNKILAIQVKSAIANAKRKTVRFDLRKATYQTDSNRFLLAVLFDPDKAVITMSWLIPMNKMDSVSYDATSRFNLSPSTSATTTDSYRPYRHDNPQALVKAVLDVTDPSY